ncbi:MAG TPA: type IV pilin protein [Alcanivoracaceae bacterium]|nr:type IV pilin protein [Alcanivoracaceae bacterium]
MVERGITLIEMVVVLVILAVLASMSFASYQHYVKRSRQAEAKVLLLALIERLERYSLSVQERDAEKVAHIVRGYENSHYSFQTEVVDDAETGLLLWRVKALPQNSMRGSGSLGVDSRGYSCYVAHSDLGCAPSVREQWSNG